MLKRTNQHGVTNGDKFAAQFLYARVGLCLWTATWQGKRGQVRLGNWNKHECKLRAAFLSQFWVFWHVFAISGLTLIKLKIRTKSPTRTLARRSRSLFGGKVNTPSSKISKTYAAGWTTKAPECKDNREVILKHILSIFLRRNRKRSNSWN